MVAFANTNGGTFLIGINKTGEVEELSDIDDTYTRVTNGIRDSIAPDVTIFVKCILEDNQTIRIEIGEGSYKPYYLKSKGLKPSGVYVRQGASSVQASPEQIRQMIKNADGDTYEELRSIEQDLTFRYCAEIFAANSIFFGEEKFNILGIRNHNQKLYTNLGRLLSEQCTHTIKVAVFADDQNTVFRDHKEFSGSVLEQLEKTFDYLQLCNKNQSIIDGLTREDFWDYPKDAIREALLNAIIHRDYSFSGSIIINVNSRGMEFISIGGLLPGISIEDIRNGISQLRNQKLVDIFHRLNFIEAYGTGIRRIFTMYDDCSTIPDISVTQNSFKITLPNMNAAIDKVINETLITALNESVDGGKTEKPPVCDTITPQMQKVLDYLKVHETISDDEIQALLKIKRTRSFTLTRKMSEAGLVCIEGRGTKRKITL